MTGRRAPARPTLGLLALIAACGDGAAPPLAPTAPRTAAAAAITPVPATKRGLVLDTAGRAVSLARIEVVDGPRAGESVLTGERGDFAFVGALAPETEFLASKEGYAPASPDPCPGCTAGLVFFTLEPLGTTVSLAGDYLFTIVADEACDALPEALRRRSFAATISPASVGAHPGRLSLTLRDAPIREFLAYGGGGPGIGAAGDVVVVSFGDFHGAPGLVEEVGTHDYVAFGGEAAARVASADGVLELPFDGFVDHCVLSSAMAGPRYDCRTPAAISHVRCESPRHRLLLARR